MKKYIITLCCSVLILGLYSCDNFLDTEPQDSISDKSFWVSETNVQKFVTDIYANTFPVVYEGSIFFEEAMSDNSFLVWSGWYTDVKLVANGTQDAYGNAPYNLWEKHYSNIRKCWQLLENIERVDQIDSDLKNRYAAEVRVLLSYNYYKLIGYFGNVPLVKKVLSIQESKELTRTPKTEIVDFILSELTQASDVLKLHDIKSGRITWGASETLKARVYLFNNRYEELLAVTDGLIGRYSLHTAGETPYQDLFSGVAEINNEVIFSIIRDKTVGSTYTGHYGNQIFFLKGMSGGDAFRAITPAGSLVDAYPMADGRLIHETGSTYEANNPYANRDPRLLQSVICPTQQLKYFDAATGEINEALYDPENASTVPNQQYNASEPSSTGYMWNKYIDWSPYAMNQITDCTNDIIIMRYADVLLMRAEALAETQGVGAKNDIVEIINSLRSRCKGGLVHTENYNSKEDLIKLVRNERRVELANEGLRYFDMLRWKIAEKSPVIDGVGLKGDFYGAYMRLDGVGKGDKTVTIDGVPRRYVETRFFDVNKHYLQPIPQKERDLNPNLEQNPSW